MSISGVTSSLSSFSDPRARFKAFKGGQANITKNDLTQLKAKLDSRGVKESPGLEKLTDNFDQIDTNGDGISYQELQSYEKTNGPLASPSGQAQAGQVGGLQDPDGEPGMSKDDLVALQAKLAANGGNTDTLSKAISSFSKVDTNGDGKISMAEMRTFAQQNNLAPQAAGKAHHHHHGGGGKKGGGDLLEQLFGNPTDPNATDATSTAGSTSTASATGATAPSAAALLLQKLVANYGSSTSSYLQDLTSPFLANVQA